MASLLAADGSLPLDHVGEFRTLDRIASWAEQYRPPDALP
jgi:hypothetical protein